MGTIDLHEAPVLVVGATGRHGGTGSFLVRQLRARGVAVRALARVADARAEALRALGAEVVIGDLHDRRTLAPALHGVSAAYFTYPVKDGIVEAAANFAEAARSAALPRLVVMSIAIVHPAHPSPFARAHWLAEELFGWAGITTLSLRVAALFLENLLLLHAEEIYGDGIVRNSFPDLPVPWLSGEDAAKLATAALLHPERFGGPQGVVYPSGGPARSHNEVLRVLGAQLGRALRHETIEPDAWVARLRRESASDDRIDAITAHHIALTGAALSHARSPRPPVPFAELTGVLPLEPAAAFAIRERAL